MELSTKVKVFVLNPNEGLNGVTYWRLYQPFDFLQAAHGDEIDITYNRGELQVQDFLQHDVYFFLRPYMPMHLHMIQELKRYRRHFGGLCPIIMDFDDDNKSLPHYHLNYRDEGLGYQYTKECLQYADAVWTSTLPILESYQPDAHPETEFSVIPNSVSAYDMFMQARFNPIEDKKKSAGVMWWGGSAGHHHDLYAWESQYYKLAERASKFYFTGYLPPFKHGDNLQYIPHILPTLQYFEAVKQARPNYIWKPLQNNKFNDAKSNIQYLTATLAGALCLTNYAGRPGWEYAVKDLVRDNDEAHRLWKEAKDDIQRRYNLTDATKQRYDSIMRLVHAQ